jgi:hypothetical protein
MDQPHDATTSGHDDATGFEEIALGDGERRLGQIIGEWRELAGRVEDSSYFQTPEWVLSWWEDRGRPPTVVGLWRDASGTLEAVAFLTKVREPLPRGSGHDSIRDQQRQRPTAFRRSVRLAGPAPSGGRGA